MKQRLLSVHRRTRSLERGGADRRKEQGQFGEEVQEKGEVRLKKRGLGQRQPSRGSGEIPAEGIQKGSKGQRLVLGDRLAEQDQCLLCLARLHKDPAELRLAHSCFTSQEHELRLPPGCLL